MTVVGTTIDAEALAIPAPYVDRFQVSSLDGALVRLSFAETLGLPGRGNYRAAVMISADNARELALTLLTMLGTSPPTPS